MFFFAGFGGINGLQGVRMHPRIIYHFGHRHGGGREILHLFQLKTQIFGFGGEVGHVGFFAAWVRRNKVGNERLPQIVFFLNLVVFLLKFLKILKRRLPHDAQRVVGSVFGRDFQTARHVVCNELLHVLVVVAVLVVFVEIVHQ